MKISFATGIKNGASHYRIEQPLKLMNELGLASVLEMTNATIDLAAAADIFVIPALYSSVEKTAFLKDGGSKMILDIWDDPFNISPWSPSYSQWGTKEVVINTPDGEAVPLWKDKERGLNIAANFDRQQDLKRFLEFADLVTVTTQRLGERMLPYCRKIRVLPDSIDFTRWDPLPLRKTGDVRLMWGGGSSHYADLRMLEAPLSKVMAEYPQVRLVLMGEQFAKGAIKLDGFEDRVERHKWVPICCYPLKMASLNIDIGLIPLQGNTFDECKSPLKWAELGAFGIPAIASGVPPYIDVYNGNNMALVAENNPDSWFDAISTLVENFGLRGQIGKAAQDTVKLNYDARSNAKLWAKVYQEVMSDGN